MKRILTLFALLLFIGGCSSAGKSNDDSFVQNIFNRYPSLAHQQYSKDSVKRIVDGDTFETASGAKVRLIGVNTPEITNGKNEAYGQEAKAYSEKKLEGYAVYLFRDAGDKDKYGRLLRYVFIQSEPVMFNELLVSEGYANVMTVPPNVMYADTFVMKEREARSQGRGLWSAEDRTAQQPAAPCKSPAIKGNINAKNEKIYHVPGGKYYAQTKAEVMFCSEEDALAAGFRKSAQ